MDHEKVMEFQILSHIASSFWLKINAMWEISCQAGYLDILPSILKSLNELNVVEMSCNLAAHLVLIVVFNTNGTCVLSNSNINSHFIFLSFFQVACHIFGQVINYELEHFPFSIRVSSR